MTALLLPRTSVVAQFERGFGNWIDGCRLNVLAARALNALRLALAATETALPLFRQLG